MGGFRGNGFEDEHKRAGKSGIPRGPKTYVEVASSSHTSRWSSGGVMQRRARRKIDAVAGSIQESIARDRLQSRDVLETL